MASIIRPVIAGKRFCASHPRHHFVEMRTALLAAGAVLALLPSPVRAQEAQQQAAAADDEEIIVTARKREESALKVPVVETVLTEEVIDRMAISTLADIAKFAPGLAIGQSVLSTGAQVSIRGFGTTTQDPGVDQSVALVVDGFSFSQGLAYQSGSFDLERIEVLKGPQSLFFGKASPAGVISLRTADPGDQLEVIARASYEFEAQTPRAELIFSAPITDKLGIRLAGAAYKSAGFFRNRAVPLAGTGALAPDKRLGGGDGYQLRGTLVFKPSSAFDARLKVNYVKDTTEYPGAAQLASCPEGTVPSSNAFPRPISPDEDCHLDRDIFVVDMDPAAFPAGLNTKGGKQFNTKKQVYGTLELNFYPTDDLTVTSVTGYYHLDSDVYFNTFQTGFSGSHFATSSLYKREEFTQELRVNSDFEGPLNFTVGGFYHDADVSMLQSTLTNLAVRPAAAPITRSQLSTLKIQAGAVFAQLRYRPVEQLELAAGGRYSDEARSNSNINALTGLPIPTARRRISSGTFSPELTISYFPNDNTTLFASYKKGYKSGSFTLSALPAEALPNNAFGDEKVEGGEAGIKARLFDRQLTTDLAVYYYKFSGLQLSISQADAVSGSLPVVRVVNAGAARNYGVDFEIAFRPRSITGLNLHAAVAWNNSKFTELEGVPCYGGQTIALGCNAKPNPNTGAFTAQGDLAGLPLLRSPRWQASFGASYEMGLPNDWSLTLSNDNHYASSQRLLLNRRADGILGKYLKIDLAALLKGPGERWELAFIAKNITNKITTGQCLTSNFTNYFLGRNQPTGRATNTPDGVDEVACIAEPGRSLIVRATFKYH